MQSKERNQVVHSPTSIAQFGSKSDRLEPGNPPSDCLAPSDRLDSQSRFDSRRGPLIVFYWATWISWSLCGPNFCVSCIAPKLSGTSPKTGSVQQTFFHCILAFSGRPVDLPIIFVTFAPFFRHTSQYIAKFSSPVLLFSSLPAALLITLRHSISSCPLARKSYQRFSPDHSLYSIFST